MPGIRNRSTAFATALVMTVALGGASTAQAQTQVLDEGSFRILQNGNEVGMESFSIERSGSGAEAVTTATGRVTLNGTGDAEEITSELEVAGPALRPATYRVDVRGDEAQRIAGRVVGGRFSARITSSAGEMMREYLAGEGAVVLDEGIAHHYYFLTRDMGDAEFSVPVLVPRESRQISANVRPGGMETIESAGQQVRGRSVVVAPSEGPNVRLWVDDSGRLLRVEIPAENRVAVRTSLP